MVVVSGIGDALHAKDVATGTLASNWLDADLIADPTLELLSFAWLFDEVLWSQHTAFHHHSPPSNYNQREADNKKSLFFHLSKQPKNTPLPLADLNKTPQ